MELPDYRALVIEGHPPEAIYRRIRADATRLAGLPDDFAQRAAIYYALYRLSGRNFSFALIAAHEALWARWYLALARPVTQVLALTDITCALSPRRKMMAYDKFISAFKRINRRVLIETYTVFQFTRVCGRAALKPGHLPATLLAEFEECHELARAGLTAGIERQRPFFEAYFRWEQVTFAGPAADEAARRFSWPMMKWLCRRPVVWFACFPFARALCFEDITNAQERVAKGVAAFDLAAQKGWSHAERTLSLPQPLVSRGLAAPQGLESRP